MSNNIDSLPSLVDLLARALSGAHEREAMIAAFQSVVLERKTPVSGADEKQWEILHDLALDLDYYEPREHVRREDPAFYGDDRLETEIRSALAKLG